MAASNQKKSSNSTLFCRLTEPGLDELKIKLLANLKHEPAWMSQQRVAAYHQFLNLPLPNWGVDLKTLDFDQIHYYLSPVAEAVTSWDQVPAKIKRTFEKLKVPQTERAYLAGLTAQYDSEVVYGSLHQKLQAQGVIFLSMDQAIQQQPALVKKYWGKVIAANDNKFSALNSAVWSGGSFIYVPAGVKVELPLQTYFRLNSQSAGQFERTLIIVGEGASVHYVEGCTAPKFSTGSLHAGVVEVIVEAGGRCQYTTIQNWYPNVYNLVTKRALVAKQAEMIWTDFNLGSQVTMKYPASILAEEGAKSETLSLAMAGPGQIIDSGAKAIHLASHTSSTIISKSVSFGGGRASYRGLVKMTPAVKQAHSYVKCDALLLDDQSESDTYPVNDIAGERVSLNHEATVSRIETAQLSYLQSRGLSELQARKMIINGFIGDLVKKLPFEYAVEMNRLIDLEMSEGLG